MNIIGQKKNIPTIEAIASNIKKGKNLNISIFGSSGMGKTHIAKEIVKNSSNFLEESVIYTGDINRIVEERRIHILDESHEIKTPEILYPYMDNEKYSFFILSNEYGLLKEPMVNRTIQITLEEYSEEELGQIGNLIFLDEFGKGLSKRLQLIIGEKSRGSPREAKNIAKRVLLFRKTLPNTESELRGILGLSGIYRNGYRDYDLEYLKFLEKHSPIGIDNICRGIGMDKDFVQEKIEPFLIMKNKISITKKGRVYL
jgi:Holliday junction resolvasome RuvABC ATP-dependent DNA helicase subunit